MLNFDFKGVRNKDFITTSKLKELLLQDDCMTELIDKDFFSLHLAYILSHCSNCRKVNPANPFVPCMGLGCYLEVMGLDLSAPTAKNQVALLSQMCQSAFICGRTIYDAKGVIDTSHDLIQRETQLQNDLDKLEEDKQKLIESKAEITKQIDELNKEKNEVKAKKDKLGRPSKLDKRRMDYERYWFQADPKPSMVDLAEKIGVSRKTAYTDIQRISKEKGLMC